jgi:hypothetical protein
MLKRILLIAAALSLFNYVPKGLVEFLGGGRLLWSPELLQRLHETSDEHLVFSADIVRHLSALRSAHAEDFMISLEATERFQQDLTAAAFPLPRKTESRIRFVTASERSIETYSVCRSLLDAEGMALIDCR